MATPAKKAAPSLSDLVKKDKDEQHPDNQTQGDDNPKLSDNVVATVPNKTPSELAAETPEETEARYGKIQEPTEHDLDNLRVQVTREDYIKQVPSGTHLHPDIAKDLMNRGISQHTTDSAQVRREITNTYDFAPDAENNDKMPS